jgi:hypothetical protein
VISVLAALIRFFRLAPNPAVDVLLYYICVLGMLGCDGQKQVTRRFEERSRV